MDHNSSQVNLGNAALKKMPVESGSSALLARAI
jgi:hypothetical protein